MKNRLIVVMMLVLVLVAIVFSAGRATAGVPELGTLILEYEKLIEYSAQNDAWRDARDGWLSAVRNADTARSLGEQLVKLEESLTWESQAAAWRDRRDGWVRETKQASSPAILARLLKEFETNVKWEASGAAWRDRRDGWLAEVEAAADGTTTLPDQPPAATQNLPTVTDPVIYANGNIGGVENNPTRETRFTINAAHRVTFIYTYHYFNNGTPPGTIALRHSDGTMYGPWPAEGALGQGGVLNAYWFVRPNVEIKAGTYTVIDSNRSTWSQNDQSGGAGFVEVRGTRGATAVATNAVTPPMSANRLTVSPSTEPQTVTVSGVSVTIPGGLLASAATLTVAPSRAAAQLPKPMAEAVVLGAYDISLGEAATFAQALTLSIPYDPATLDPGMPEGKNLWVSSWDASAGAWVDHAVEVDTASKRLIVRTDHLSTWLYWRAQGFRRVPSSWWGPCEVYYNPNQAQPRTDVAAGYTMEDLANDVVTAMTAARQAYKAAGFTPPNYQVKVIIHDWDDSQLNGRTGNIYLKRTELRTLATLRQECGHELFHVFQNQYYNVYGMGYRHWWMESTSDYASAVIAWHNLAELPAMEATYFEESLFSATDAHCYQNGRYLLYLANRRNVNFRALWDAVKINSGTRDNGVAAFQNYVAGATGKDFDDEWVDFLDYALFTPGGPMGSVATSGFKIVDVARTGTEVSKRGSRIVSVPSYAAKIIVVGVGPAPGKTTRPIKVSATGLGSGTRVEIWQLRNNDRSTARLKNVLVDNNSIAYFDLNVRDRVWAVVLNTTATERSVTVTAADSAGNFELKLTPAQTQVAPGAVLPVEILVVGGDQPYTLTGGITAQLTRNQGSARITAPATAGAQVVRVQVRDKYGLVATQSFTYTVVSAPPVRVQADTNPALTRYVASFTGTWSSNWGTMTLKAEGLSVTGQYTHDAGRISAVLSADGRTMTGTWSEAPSYSPPTDAGRMTFSLSADGRSLTGQWGYGDNLTGGGWTGTKLQP